MNDFLVAFFLMNYVSLFKIYKDLALSPLMEMFPIYVNN